MLLLNWKIPKLIGQMAAKLINFQIKRYEAEYGKPANATGVWTWFHLVVLPPLPLISLSTMYAPSPSHSHSPQLDDDDDKTPLSPPLLLTTNIRSWCSLSCPRAVTQSDVPFMPLGSWMDLSTFTSSCWPPKKHHNWYWWLLLLLTMVVVVRPLGLTFGNGQTPSILDQDSVLGS